MLINSDRSKIAIVHGTQLPWSLSPEQGIERRMLERVGDEVALATSIVRYEPNTRFGAHTHDFGEEFLVLEGTFADEHGAYPAGTYVRNPPGSTHAPYSIEGCTILVKLRQMVNDEAEYIRNFSHHRHWNIDAVPGIGRAQLYTNNRLRVELARMQAGSNIPMRHHERGEELFVVEGSVQWCGESPITLDKWSWLRHPGDNHCAILSQTDSVLWIKRGHL
jgi:anti-sigma factor ChrR (cupin superfamily)